MIQHPQSFFVLSRGDNEREGWVWRRDGGGGGGGAGGDGGYKRQKEKRSGMMEGWRNDGETEEKGRDGYGGETRVGGGGGGRWWV